MRRRPRRPSPGRCAGGRSPPASSARPRGPPPPITDLTVPSSPHCRPAASSSARTRNAVVVFPFVPVTPTTSSDAVGSPKKRAAATRHRRADVLHHDLGHPEAERPLHHQRRRAARDRVGREVVPVAGESRHAEEQRARLHRPVVERQARDAHVGGPFAQQLAQGHRRGVYERRRRGSREGMGDVIEQLMRGNVAEVKVVLSSVAFALAAYQLVLAAVGYGAAAAVLPRPAAGVHDPPRERRHDRRAGRRRRRRAACPTSSSRTTPRSTRSPARR